MGPKKVVDELSQDITWADDDLVVIETDDYFETHDDYETDFDPYSGQYQYDTDGDV